MIPPLAGRWTARRLVGDFLARRLLRGEGTAVWGADGRLTEVLTFDGLEARRETLWTVTEDGVSIAYGDGAPMVDIPNGGVGTHLCAPDTYAARLSMDGAGALWVAWRVRGPRKDYAMVTVYRRMG